MVTVSLYQRIIRNALPAVLSVKSLLLFQIHWYDPTRDRTWFSGFWGWGSNRYSTISSHLNSTFWYSNHFTRTAIYLIVLLRYNPFPHTIYCSRRFRKDLVQNMETVFKWKNKYLIKLISLWQKEILPMMNNFSFISHNVFKIRLLVRHLKASILG